MKRLNINVAIVVTRAKSLAFLSDSSEPPLRKMPIIRAPKIGEKITSESKCCIGQLPKLIKKYVSMAVKPTKIAKA